MSMETIENLFSASEEIILERKLEDAKVYKELSSQNDIAFKKLVYEIRSLTDPVKRKKLEKLIFSYNNTEARYKSFAIHFAYLEGTKIGYSFSKFEDCLNSFK